MFVYYSGTENEKNKSEIKASVNDEKKIGAKESPEQNTRVSRSSSALPCMDKLKEELSCAVRMLSMVQSI